MKELRQRYHLDEPYQEFAYKRLNSGARKRALREFLDLSDGLIHGVLVTVLIDKNIESIFGPIKNSVHPELVKLFKDAGLGEWKGNEAEKILRVCHPIAIFMSLLTHDGQKFLWYCDNDSINVDSNIRGYFSS